MDKPGLDLLVSIVEEDREKALWLATQLQDLANHAMASDGQNMSPRMLVAMFASAIGYSMGNGTRVAGGRLKELEDSLLIAECIMEDSARDAFHGA